MHAKLASPSISQFNKSENSFAIPGDSISSPIQPSSRPIHIRSAMDTDSSAFSQFNNSTPDPLSHQGGTSLFPPKKREPNYSELLADFLSWPPSSVPSVPQPRSTSLAEMIEPPPGFIPSHPHQHLSGNAAHLPSYDTRKIVNTTHLSLPPQQSTHKENRASFSDVFHTVKLTDEPFSASMLGQFESTSPKSFPNPTSPHIYHNLDRSRSSSLRNTFPFANRSKHSILRHQEPSHSVPALSHHPIRHPVSSNQGDMMHLPRRREAVFTSPSPARHRQVVTTSHSPPKD